MSAGNILYLHGFRMNADVMKFQTRKLRRMFKDYNHHIINGTYIANGDPPDVIKRHFKPPFYEFCQFEYGLHPENNEENVKYFGIEETIKTLKDIAMEKEIDGIIGFSQGSYIGSILSNEIPIKFFVSVCGMQCLDEQYKMNHLVPSFHIVGKNDEWFQRGLEFHNQYENAMLCEHGSGHNFPSETDIYNKLAAWLDTLQKTKTC